MDAPVKQVESAVTWAKTRQRWPLLLPLLGIPATFQFISSSLKLTALETAAHPLFFVPSAILLVIAPVLIGIVRGYPRFRRSPFMARRHDRPLVLVDRAIAWRYLPPRSSSKPCVVDDVEVALQEIRPDWKVFAGSPALIDDRVRLCVTGTAAGGGLLLEVLGDGKTSAELKFPWARSLPLEDFRELSSGRRMSHTLPRDLHEGDAVAALRLMLAAAIADRELWAGEEAQAAAALSHVERLTGLVSPKLQSVVSSCVSTAAFVGLSVSDTDRVVSLLGLAHDPRDATYVALLRVLAMLKAGRPAQALHAAKALPVDTRPALVHALLAECYTEARDDASAFREYEAALRSTQNPDARRRLHVCAALAAALRNDVRGVDRGRSIVAHLESAATDTPHPDALSLQAFGWALFGEDAKAREVLSDLALDADASPMTFNFYLRTLNVLGDHQAVLELRAPDQFTDAPFLMREKAHAMLELGQPPEEAEGLLRDALKREPKERHSLELLSEALRARAVQTADPASKRALEIEARKYLLQANRDEPWPSTHLALARSYLASGDIVNSEKHARDSVRLDPTGIPNAQLHGELLLRIGDVAAARDSFQHARANSDSDPLLLIEQGIAWQEADHLDDARKAYEAALGLARFEQHENTARNHLAYVLLDLGEGVLALEHWEHVLANDPENIDVRAGAALALFEKGERDKAVAYYNRAVKGDPRFRDPGVLKSDFAWSDNACSILGQLQASAVPTTSADIPRNET